MLKLWQLKGKARRRCLALLRRLNSDDLQEVASVSYPRKEWQFRDAERLHKSKLITACVSKWSVGSRPFKELALFVSESAARKSSMYILPRR